MLGIDLKTQFFIRKCKNCSFVFVNPRLEKTLYLRVYNEAKAGQYGNCSPGSIPGQHFRDMFYKWRAAVDFLSVISYFKSRFDHFDNGNNGQIRLLDYGCGMGHLLELCKVFGFYAVGVDIDRVRLELCAKKGLKVSLPHELPVNEQFDIVVSRAVIEHIEDLKEYFYYISQRLNKGGIFSVDGLTPKMIAIERKKKRYKNVMPLEHLNFFTPKSLNCIASKYGFQKIHRIQNVHLIQKPAHYLYPIIKNIIFRGFYPTGTFKLDLIKVS